MDGIDEISVEDMASRYIDEIQRVRPHGPYLLSGWSFGGLVAFEMAQQLRAAGEDVPLLILFDASLPSGRRGSQATSPSFAEELGCNPASVQPGRAGDEVPQLESVFEWARLAQVIPTDMELSQVRRMFEVYLLSLRAMRRYKPRTYPGRVAFFRAAERVRAKVNTAYPWTEFISGPLEVRMVQGNHYSMLREPHVGTLVERLRELIAPMK
jgi:thioesterase domain-containing protein